MPLRPILLASLTLWTVSTTALAQPEATAPKEAVAPAPAVAAVPAPAASGDDWIRPEEVVDRADALGQRLDTRRAGTGILAAVRKIETEITRLNPELEAGFESAKAALSGHASLIAIQDARSELERASGSFPSWKTQLDGEARRIAEVLDEIKVAEHRWSQTLEHPETADAGEVVVRRVESSLAALETAAEDLQAWRITVLALNDRLLDRSTAVEDALRRLEAATLAEGAGLMVPDHAPLWRRNILPQIVQELVQVGPRMAAFHRSTTEYFAHDARPFLLQLLMLIALMFAMRGLPEGSRRRMSQSQASPETLRLLQRPYAVAFLLTLITSPGLHPAAPHRVMQFLGMVALVPVARVLMLANDRINLSLYVGLFTLLIIDRLSIALTPLPGISLVIFLAELVIAFALAFEYRRRLRESGGAPWVITLLTAAMCGVTLGFIAEIGGWSSLAALIGRGIMVSGTGALYVYAATISLEALFAYVLASPALRTSRFFDRNQALVQRWTAIGLRLAGAVYWLRIVVNSLGLREVVSSALTSLLAFGVSVGALSISVGGVLAFVLTLVVAVFLSRLIHEVLEDEIFPRTNLPRGIPHALLTLTNYAIYSLGFLLALAAAGVQLGQLSILLGGLGVGIGLGLQDVVKNFAAGITILLERRVHVGDAVEIPDKKVFGRVLAIGMRASVVRNWNGTEVVMPNDDLVSGTVTNWTLTDASHRLEVKVGVAYGTDPEQVVELLLAVARSNDRLLTTPAPAALFVGFGESSLDFVLRAWSGEQYETAAAQTSDLGIAVNHALGEAGITVPFPQRDLHLASVSEQVGVAFQAGAGMPSQR